MVGSRAVATDARLPSQLVIVGGSHVAVFRSPEALVETKNNSLAASVIGVPPPSSLRKSRPRLRLRSRSEEARHLAWFRTLSDKAPGSAIAMLFRGSQMDMRALIAEGRSFDVVAPGDSGEPILPETEIIPSSVPMHFVRESLDGDVGLNAAIDECRRVGAVRVAMLSPPPPLPGSEVRGRLQHSAYFQQRMSQGGFAPDDVTLVPDAVRCRLWRLMVEAYRSFAEDHEVDFLASPAEAQDSAGNLRSEFWHPRDGTHANGKYGQEYLRQIRAWAGGTR